MSCRRWLPALLIVYGLSPSSQPATLHSFAHSQAGPARARHDDYTQGLTYYRSKEYAAAVEAFNRALKENPGSLWLIYHLARSHLHLKNRAAAEVLAKKLVHEDPSFARGYFLLGYIQFEERQYPLAEQNLRRAVQLEPAYWESHQALGLTYVLQDRHEEAEEELREAVQLNPNDPDAHYYMGRLYSTRSKFVAALKEFSKMRDLDPLSVKASTASTAVTLAPPRASMSAARPVPVPTSRIARSWIRPIMFASTRACMPATRSPIGPPKRRSSKLLAIAGSA